MLAHKCVPQLSHFVGNSEFACTYMKYNIALFIILCLFVGALLMVVFLTSFLQLKRVLISISLFLIVMFITESSSYHDYQEIRMQEHVQKLGIGYVSDFLPLSHLFYIYLHSHTHTHSLSHSLSFFSLIISILFVLVYMYRFQGQSGLC